MLLRLVIFLIYIYISNRVFCRKTSKLVYQTDKTQMCAGCSVFDVKKRNYSQQTVRSTGVFLQVPGGTWMDCKVTRLIWSNRKYEPHILVQPWSKADLLHIYCHKKQKTSSYDSWLHTATSPMQSVHLEAIVWYFRSAQWLPVASAGSQWLTPGSCCSRTEPGWRFPTAATYLHLVMRKRYQSSQLTLNKTENEHFF